MTEKRIKVNVIQNLPLDCWSVVISYIDCKKTFFALLLTVRGLWNYLRSINPVCTKLINYQVRSIPSIKYPHVTNLEFLNDENSRYEHHCESICRLFNDFRVFSLDMFFSLLFNRFPNLLRLKTTLIADSDYMIEEEIVKFYIKNQKTIPLRSFTFICCNCLLDVKQTFPFLRTLVLANGIEDEKPDLKLEWKYFPKLRDLKLYDWKLQRNIDCLGRKLDSLLLDDIEGASSFFLLKNDRLKNLEIRSTTLSDIESFDHFVKLETLILRNRKDGTHQIFEIKRMDERLNYDPEFRTFDIHFNVIQNLNHLSKLIIDTSHPPQDYEHLYTSSYPPSWNFVEVSLSSSKPIKRKSQQLYVQNLPSLRHLELQYLDFPIRLENVPKLSVLRTHNCQHQNSIRFTFPDDTSELEELVFINGVPISCNTLTKIFESSAKKNLRIIQFKNNIQIEPTEDLRIIKICDFPNLKVLDCAKSPFLISEISNCPNLEYFTLRPTKDFIISGCHRIMKNLPSDFLGLTPHKHEMDTLINILDQLKRNENMSIPKFIFVSSESNFSSNDANRKKILTIRSLGNVCKSFVLCFGIMGRSIRLINTFNRSLEHLEVVNGRNHEIRSFPNLKNIDISQSHIVCSDEDIVDKETERKRYEIRIRDCEHLECLRIRRSCTISIFRISNLPALQKIVLEDFSPHSKLLIDEIIMSQDILTKAETIMVERVSKRFQERRWGRWNFESFDEEKPIVDTQILSLQKFKAQVDSQFQSNLFGGKM